MLTDADSRVVRHRAARGNRGFTRAVVACLVAALFAQGCASFTRPPRDPKLPSDVERLKTAVDDGTESEVSLEAEFNAKDAFLLHPANKSDPLPNILLNNISVTESGLYDAMQVIAKIAGLSISVEGGARALERYGSTAVMGLSGGLPDVMENLSNSLGFFYSVNNGILTIAPEQQFVIEMPPSLQEDNIAGIIGTLQYLGARDVFIDRLNRSFTFRGTKKVVASVDAYLQRIRTTRSLLVYDVHVYQVDLADSNESGVQWNKFTWANAAGSAVSSGGSGAGTSSNLSTAVTTTATQTATAAADKTATFVRSGGFGVGATLTGPKFNIDLLVNFLRTQGTVKNISQPRMALLTGSKGSLRVGQATTYVSKVGTNVSANLNQVTVETKDLQTGFELTLFGEEHDGTIYTRVQMLLSDLVKFNRFTALGTDLTLPQTADREVRTSVRARPGDVILLGGITVSKDSIDVSTGITANTKAASTQRSELVIALRPKVVRFISAKGGAATTPVSSNAVTPANPASPGEPNPFQGTTGRPYSVVEPREPVSSATLGQAAGNQTGKFQ